MARPSKYNWDEIIDHYLAGMSRDVICDKFGCKPSSLSEELKKRGIKEPDQKRVQVKDAIVSAVSRVSEVSEIITENERNSIINVAAHESGYIMLLQRAASAGVNKALELLETTDSQIGVKAFMDSIDKATGILAPEHKAKATAPAQQPITAVQVNLKVVK
jgi:hypothetical protein